MRKWTDKLVKILRQEYPRKGSNIRYLRKRFSNETIRAKAKKLKIKVSKTWWQQHFRNTLDKHRVIRWGKKELAILKREYPRIGIKVKRLLKKFTKAAIKQKANILEIKRKVRTRMKRRHPRR